MAEANPYTRSPICSYQSPQVGKSVQNVAISWVDGTQAQLNDLLRWTADHLLLLWFGPTNQATLQKLKQLTELAPVRVVQVLDRSQPAQARETVRDSHGHLAAACGHPGWALLRPDSYMSASGTRLDAGFLKQLSTALALS